MKLDRQKAHTLSSHVLPFPTLHWVALILHILSTFLAQDKTPIAYVLHL